MSLEEEGSEEAEGSEEKEGGEVGEGSEEEEASEEKLTSHACIKVSRHASIKPRAVGTNTTQRARQKTRPRHHPH